MMNPETQRAFAVDLIELGTRLLKSADRGTSERVTVLALRRLVDEMTEECDAPAAGGGQ